MKKIVLIGGYGRSGSTMLEIVLSDFCGAVGVGEIKHSWRRGFLNGVLCSCGVPTTECSFWKPVLEEVRKATGLTIAEIDALRLKVERNRHFLIHRVLGVPSAGYQSAREAYKQVLKVLYEAVWRVSGKAVIIDASKDPAHIDLVAEIFPARTTVIHLVRDPRAVVYSRRYSRTAENKKRRASLLTSCYEWIAINLFTARLRKRTQYVLVKYEDAFRSTGHLLSIFEWEPAIAQCRAADSATAIYHSAWGNPVRHEAPGDLTLQVDTRWQDQLPATERWLVGLLCGPTMHRFGYIR